MSKEEREYYIKRNAKEKRKEENLDGIGKFIFFAAIVVLIFVFDWEENSAILICLFIVMVVGGWLTLFENRPNEISSKKRRKRKGGR